MSGRVIEFKSWYYDTLGGWWRRIENQLKADPAEIELWRRSSWIVLKDEKWGHHQLMWSSRGNDSHILYMLMRNGFFNCSDRVPVRFDLIIESVEDPAKHIKNCLEQGIYIKMRKGRMEVAV